jgi:3-oxoacyl-[acyl-carrier-protein] synthase II
VLEELGHAQARGATILAEYLGGSSTCDAHHMTEPHPDGRGVQLAIETALKVCGITADQVSYVNAHGTSTPAGDLAEYRAIRRVLSGPGVKVNSTKSMIGHLLGAAGAVEAVATVMAIQTGKLHPNPNLVNPDPDVDLNVVVGKKALDHPVEVAMSNSFGFGGHNSCIVFGKWHGK